MKKPEPPPTPAYDLKELLVPLLDGAPIIIDPRKWHRVCFAANDDEETEQDVAKWMAQDVRADFEYSEFDWCMEVLQRNNTTQRIIRIVTPQHSFGLMINTEVGAVTVKAARELAAAVYFPEGNRSDDPALYLIAKLPPERVD